MNLIGYAQRSGGLYCQQRMIRVPNPKGGVDLLPHYRMPGEGRRHRHAGRAPVDPVPWTRQLRRWRARKPH